MKKSVKIILVGIIIVLLFVIVFGFFNRKEKNDFNLFIDKLYNGVNNYKRMSLDMDVSVSGDVFSSINSEVLRDVSFDAFMNYDLNKNIYLVDFNSNYKGSSIVSGSMYYNDDMYIKLNDLYDSVIKSNKYDIDINGMLDSVYNAFSNAASAGEVESSNDEYVLIINNKNKDKVVKEFVSSIKKSKGLVNLLDEIGIDIKDIKINKLDNDIKVVMNTDGDKFEKLSVLDGEKEIGYITPSEKNIKIKLYLDSFKIMTIISKHKEDSFSITSNIYTSEKSFSINANVSYSKEVKFDKFDIDNAVKLGKDDKKNIEDKFNNIESIIELKKDSEELKKNEEVEVNELEKLGLIESPFIE